MASKVKEIFEDYVKARLEGKSFPVEDQMDQLPPDDQEWLRKKISAMEDLEDIFQKLPKIRTTPHEFIDQKKEENLEQKEFAGCKLLKKIGQGGMGVVYLARQEKLKRNVVIKILRTFAAKNEALRKRFVRESEIIASLENPHIVSIYDVGEETGSFYIIMKYLEGITLADLLERTSSISRDRLTMEDIGRALSYGTDKPKILNIKEKNPTEFFCNLMVQVADTVQFFHGEGVVHRDIKPSNIMIGPDGSPVLFDFGLGWHEREKDLTLSGEFLGTPVYSAPESFSPENPENYPALDVYSLGITLYEAITGELPYSGNNVYEIYNNVKNKEPTPPRTHWKNIPHDLETIILKSIFKTSSYRYSSARALSRDLSHFLNYQPIEASPPSLVHRIGYFTKRNRQWLALSFLGLLIIGAFLYTQTLSHTLKMEQAERVLLQSMVDLQTADENRVKNDYESALAYNKEITFDLMDVSLPNLASKTIPLNFINELKKDLQKNPNDVEILETLAGMSLATKKFEEAKALSELILTLNPKDFIAFFILARIIIVRGDDIEAAKKLVVKFNAQFPHENYLNVLLGTKCFLEKEYKCAIEYLGKAEEQNPRKYQKLLAAAYADDGNYKEAIKNYKEALIYHPADVDIYYNLALWLTHIKNYPEALKYAQKGLNIEKDNKILKNIRNAIKTQMESHQNSGSEG